MKTNPRNEMETAAIALAEEEGRLAKLNVHSREYENAFRAWMRRRMQFTSDYDRDDTEVYNQIPT